MPDPPSHLRRKGKAVRKNVPLAKRAPPPRPRPETSLGTGAGAGTSRHGTEAWTINSSVEAIDRLVREGVAYRFLARPINAPEPTPEHRLPFSPASESWQERNPRSAAALALKVHTTPISYAPRNGFPIKLPDAFASMQQMIDFGAEIKDQALSGRSLSIALGEDPELDAVEVMTSDEREMYLFWKEGTKLPKENWEAMEGRLEDSDDLALWVRRAEDLNKIYDVTSVTAGRAKAWWNSSDGWRPLLLACGKVRKAQFETEKRTLQELRKRIEAHMKWVKGHTARYDENMLEALTSLETIRAFSDAHMKLIQTAPDCSPLGLDTSQKPVATSSEEQSRKHKS